MAALRARTREVLIFWKKWRQDELRKLRFRITQPRSIRTSGRKLDFVIAGAQKSGTTALDEYLREHSSIVMAQKKELHFFDVDRHFRTRPDYTLYHSYFDWRDTTSLFGEATPNYMFSARAGQRIQQYNPDMKIILVLRNPVERAYSHWNMERDRGYEKREFIDAIQPELGYLSGAAGSPQVSSSYLLRGFYVEQIERLWTLFSKEQVLILRYESLQKDGLATLDKVASFLKVPPFQHIKERQVHARTYQRKMSQQERQLLNDVYASELASLADIVDWDCSQWLEQKRPL